MTTKITSLYVDINCILDIRLGTLLKISSKFAYNVTSNEKYYIRDLDVFSTVQDGVLSTDRYKEVFTRFKDEIVKSSIKTKLYIFIYELLNKLIISSIDSPVCPVFDIVINTHPYNFTNEELSLIKKSVYISLNEEFNISFINKPITELTTEYVKNNYKALFMYDYGPWLDYHYREIQKRALKDIFLYVPKIKFVKELTKEQQAMFKDRNMDIFEFLEFLLCDFITLQCLPVKLFSADTPVNK